MPKKSAAAANKYFHQSSRRLLRTVEFFSPASAPTHYLTLLRHSFGYTKQPVKVWYEDVVVFSMRIRYRRCVIVTEARRLLPERILPASGACPLVDFYFIFLAVLDGNYYEYMQLYTFLTLVNFISIMRLIICRKYHMIRY
jgi:hypothetical protein